MSVTMMCLSVVSDNDLFIGAPALVWMSWNEGHIVVGMCEKDKRKSILL